MVALSAHANRTLARQHGTVNTEQLIAAGHTPNQIRWLHRNGQLEKVLHGASRSPSAPTTELGRCAAVSLARPHVTIAGPTAGRLWGLRRLPRDPRINVIAPPASQPAIARWVQVYRTAAIRPEDIIERSDGIRVTSRARTAFDLARWLPSEPLLSVIEQVMHDGKLVEADLSAVAAPWLSPHRPWAVRFMEALAQRQGGGPAESDPEVRVAAALSARRIDGLVRQYPLTLGSGRKIRFDLAVPSRRVAVEVDVHPHHFETAGQHADATRDRQAAALGWSTLRVSRHDYLHRFNARLDEVAQEIRGLTRRAG